MKHLLLIGLLSMAVTFNVFAQQVTNPGFEYWENAGTVSDEPVNWSSIKTSDNEDLNPYAPLVWEQSSDAHNGSYSLKLFNVFTLNIVATGTITNGRAHSELVPANGYVFTDPENEQWHTVFTTRPDSVVIWAKYTPQGTDTAQVKVLLHTGAGTLPSKPENEGNRVGYAQINIVGTVDTWTRFAAPFEYVTTGNPEYMLIVLTAGAGTLAVAESTVLYDDIALIYEPISVEDGLSLDKNLIYSSHNFLIFDRFPENMLNQAMLEIFDLQGAVVYKSLVSGNQISIGQLHVPPALYVVRISGLEINYSQKLYLQ